MFGITDETKNAAVEAMKEVLGPDVSDDKIHEALDAAIKIVARSFGM